MEQSSTDDKAWVRIELGQIDTKILKEDGVKTRRKMLIIIGLFLSGAWAYQNISVGMEESQNNASVAALVSAIFFPMLLIGISFIFFGAIGLANAWGRITKLKQRKQSLVQLLEEKDNKSA